MRPAVPSKKTQKSATASAPVGFERGTTPLRRARTCYGHLAGRLGVTVTELLVERGYLRLDGRECELTPRGERWFADFGVQVPPRTARGRPPAYACVDGTERVPHLGGALGRLFAGRLFELGWLRRASDSRAVSLTPSGRRGLDALFEVDAFSR